MSTTILIRVTSLVLLCGALLLTPTAPVGAAAAVSADSAIPGTVAFQATGFADDERLSTWLTGPSQQVQAARSQEANGSGDVSFSLRIPRHFEAGRWAITVHGLDSNREAIVYFDVAAREPDLTLSAGPTSGAAGTAFAFTGSGFDTDETVSYWLSGPDGASYAGGTISAASGAVAFTYTIGAGPATGMWSMSAYGQRSDHLAVATFTVA